MLTCCVLLSPPWAAFSCSLAACTSATCRVTASSCTNPAQVKLATLQRAARPQAYISSASMMALYQRQPAPSLTWAMSMASFLCMWCSPNFARQTAPADSSADQCAAIQSHRHAPSRLAWCCIVCYRCVFHSSAAEAACLHLTCYWNHGSNGLPYMPVPPICKC